MLDPNEQIVLDRLAVFAGGFELSAAQAVAVADGPAGVDALDVVIGLVAKSLVGGGDPRRLHDIRNLVMLSGSVGSAGSHYRPSGDGTVVTFLHP